jgi:hypothetical protein
MMDCRVKPGNDGSSQKAPESFSGGLLFSTFEPQVRVRIRIMKLS